MKTWSAGVAVVLALLSMAHAAESGAGDRKIDFRYAPPWWQTSICFPDDWQKTLVGKDGELLYDWGGGPYHGFKTRIAAGVSDVAVWSQQELHAPRVPIVRTVSRLGDVLIVQEALAAPLPADDQPAPKPSVVRRVGGTSTLQNWASPRGRCIEAFRHIAVGFNEPIRYRLQAAAGKQYTVVFGLCEGWHPQTAQRVLDLQIEGRTVKTVDMVKSHGRNVPAGFAFPARDENGDGFIDVAVVAATEAIDKNTILNALWVFEGDAPPLDDLLKGVARKQALAQVACGLEAELSGPPRLDLIVMTLKNTGAGEARVTPMVTIESAYGVAGEENVVLIGGSTRLVCSAPFRIEQPGGNRTLLLMDAIAIAPGQEKTYALFVGRGRADRPLPPGADEAMALRKKAQEYWLHADLPYGHIQVPDAGVQALVDSSIRNIYQAREIKEGLPAFQVGPTCYRGLWVVDGSFLMESIAMLGRTEEARNGIKYLLKRQGKDGGFMLIDGHWKETGIVLWAVSRHAKLTQDRQWLQSVWPNVERGFAYIQNMRKIAADDPKAPNYRLVPAGFSDGGLGERGPEYTNVYWTLAGVRAAVESARWLEKTQQADAWQKEYDDFLATFRKAAGRDIKTDAHGNRCLPIYMVNGLRVPPQKAQWAFLHAVFPGKVFASDDPLVKGNMAMLRAVEDEGLVQDTGWLKDGIWNYFGSFYAHAWLWLGDAPKAMDTLYAFGNHASPLLVWREEHMPQGKGAGNVGDMPHNWASAEFIRLVRNCLVLERGDELHLLEAMPTEWTGPGVVTRLTDVATEFGPISMEIRITDDGRQADLKINPPPGAGVGKVKLHTMSLTGGDGVLQMPYQREVILRLRVRR